MLSRQYKGGKGENYVFFALSVQSVTLLQLKVSLAIFWATLTSNMKTGILGLN